MTKGHLTHHQDPSCIISHLPFRLLPLLTPILLQVGIQTHPAGRLTGNDRGQGGHPCHRLIVNHPACHPSTITLGRQSLAGKHLVLLLLPIPPGLPDLQYRITRRQANLSPQSPTTVRLANTSTSLILRPLQLLARRHQESTARRTTARRERRRNVGSHCHAQNAPNGSRGVIVKRRANTASQDACQSSAFRTLGWVVHLQEERKRPRTSSPKKEKKCQLRGSPVCCRR